MLLTSTIGFFHFIHKLLYNCIYIYRKPQVDKVLLIFQRHLNHLIHWQPTSTHTSFLVLRSHKNLSTSLKLFETNQHKGRLKSMKNAELGVTEAVLQAARCSHWWVYRDSYLIERLSGLFIYRLLSGIYALQALTWPGAMFDCHRCTVFGVLGTNSQLYRVEECANLSLIDLL